METLPARPVPSLTPETLLPSCPVTMWHQDSGLRYTWIFNPPETWKGHLQVGVSDYDLPASDQRSAVILRKEDVLTTGQPIHTTLTVSAPGEAERTYETWLEAMKTNGRVVGLAGVAVDVSEHVATERALRESETRHRQLLESSNGGIWILDAEGRTTYINPRGAAMFGAVPSDFMGERTFSAVDPTALDRARENWRRCRNGAVDDDEYQMRRRDGSTIWIQARTAPLYGANGEFAGAISVFTDITRIKLAEAEARRLADRLAEQDRAKDRFLMMLAHELRQPLNALLMAAELASHRLESDAVNPLTIVKRQAEHIRRFVDDLTDLSRVKHGTIGLRLARIDLRDSIQQAVETIQPQAKQLHQRLVSVLPPEPILIDGDGDRLQQVVSNLLHNAVKNSPDGAPILVELRKETGEAVVRVTDEGRGILAQDLPRLFEMFMQAEDAHEGMGMGLPVVKAIVDLHRGSVEARSEGRDRGAQFVVRLPIAKGASDNSESGANSRGADSQPGAPQRLMRAAGHRAHARTPGASRHSTV